MLKIPIFGGLYNWL